MWIVTGASGFVGGHVLKRLERDGSAVGLYRDGAHRGRHIEAWSRDGLRRALTGAAGVVHAASLVHRPNLPATTYAEFNAAGTRKLLEAAEDAGVKRFVFLSSIKVHGEQTESGIDEDTPLDPETPYARSKVAAEEHVRRTTSMECSIFRLCPVYGIGDKGNVRTMITSIAKRRFVLPGGGRTRKSIVHVRTVADACALALQGTASGTFVIADRDTPSLRELADTIAALLGRRRPVSVPTAVLTLAADVVGHAARRLGKNTTLSAELIRKATTDSVCDSTKAQNAFGIAMHEDFREALSEEIAWLRAQGALGRRTRG